ncbi:MAG: hypothetical protein Q9195_007562 [Heterodermia aff. obscurata]
MPSPPRPLKRSPPRKPLHDRSESSTNEQASPTIRIIDEPHAHVYSSTPFPTHPSHILAPKSAKPSGAVLEEVGVSDHHSPTDVFGKSWAEETPTQYAKSTETVESEEENIGSPVQSWPLPASRYLSPTMQPSSADEPNFDANGRSFIIDQAIDDEIVELPSVASGLDTLDSTTSIPNATHEPYQQSQQPVVPKSSDGSLSSADSTGTVIRTRPRDRPTRAFYSAFPNIIRSSTPRSNTSLVSVTTPTKSDTGSPEVDTSPVSPVSPVSPESSASSPAQPLTSHRAVSLARSDVSEGINVQYPIVRPPTASGSWAQTSENAPKRPSRNPARNPNRWNPHLSTVESEGMTDRSSGSLFFADSSRNSRTPNSRTDTPPLPVFPRPAHAPRSDVTASTIRVVNEQEDVITGLAPVPGSRSSARLSIFSSNSDRGNRRSAIHSPRPSSRGSFFRDSIPGWARTYYGRGGRTSMLPQNYSTDNLDSGLSNAPYTTTEPSQSESSLSVSRSRPKPPHFGHSRNDSMPITRIQPSEINMVEVRGAPRAKVSAVWSPHLWHDRNSAGKRRSLFIAPTVDKEAVGKAPRRRNMQVVLFTVGFLFPLAWFAAAFLPLPPKPIVDEKLKGPERRTSVTSIGQDLENRLAPMDEAHYENARWWRNLNRLMIPVGVFIIAAIIALAVVATRNK